MSILDTLRTPEHQKLPANPHMYVVGRGTVRMNVEDIVESDEYKEFSQWIRENREVL